MNSAQSVNTIKPQEDEGIVDIHEYTLKLLKETCPDMTAETMLVTALRLINHAQIEVERREKVKARYMRKRKAEECKPIGEHCNKKPSNHTTATNFPVPTTSSEHQNLSNVTTAPPVAYCYRERSVTAAGNIAQGHCGTSSILDRRVTDSGLLNYGNSTQRFKQVGHPFSANDTRRKYFKRPTSQTQFVPYQAQANNNHVHHSRNTFRQAFQGSTQATYHQRLSHNDNCHNERLPNVNRQRTF